MKKRIPKFESKEAEALFWENVNIMDYVDSDEFEVVKPIDNKKFAFVNPKKKPRKQLISIRMDAALIEKAKHLADKKHIGYQTIIRQWIERGVAS